MRVSTQIRALQRSQQLAELTDGGRALRLLPLHGGLPPQQQQRVFDRPPPGVRKVCSSDILFESDTMGVV